MLQLQCDNQSLHFTNSFNFLESSILGISKHLKQKNIAIPNAMLEVIIVDNAQSQSINKEYRGVNKPTDVLSFPLEIIKNCNEIQLLGSVIINAELSKQVAQSLNHSLENEILLLFIHGLLHILGFDHECDNGEHRELEEFLVKALNLPTSLIIRNS